MIQTKQENLAYNSNVFFENYIQAAAEYGSLIQDNINR